jgi:hypothetical protein
MMFRPLLCSVALLASLVPALAQPAPFDMTPEGGLVTPIEPDPAPETASETAPAEAVAPTGFVRHILPVPDLRLDGEEARSGVVVYLTPAQAAAPARLQFSFLNALVVAPEISNLRLLVNQVEIGSVPIAASAAPSQIDIEMPAGVLRTGPNTIEFRASQRHRTDCTVESTYQLWTQLGSDTTRLVFEGENVGRISQLSELGAVGVDGEGNTTLRLIGTGFDQPDAQEAVLRIAQQVGLAMRVPKLVIVMADAPASTPEPGTLDVIIGPAESLPAAVEQLRADAASGPFATMLALPTGQDALVLSGPNWGAVSQAGEAIAAAAPASPERPRVDLPQAPPMMLGGSAVSFDELGQERLEFNGRRYTGTMQFELPADFYGYRYAELELVLAAAYSSDVLPGSEINIYTNGEIASATPLLRTDGGLIKDSRIRIPMTNLRPGRNEATIAINLQTRSDATCAAGWTGSAPTRFVLSSASAFHLPDYARAHVVPDLQGLTGSGWPYSESDVVPMALGTGAEVLPAAAMLASRIATASGLVIDYDVVDQGELPPSANAVLVMPTTALSPLNLSRTGVSAASLGAVQNSEDFLNQFETDDLEGPLAGLWQWSREALGLNVADLRLLPRADSAYQAPSDTVVLSQTQQPEGGVWTTLTASAGPALLEGTERLIDTRKWREIAGRISALGPNDATVATVAPNAVTITTDEAWSPANIRRVAANWFSGNILYFSIAVIAGALLLMFVTSRALTRIGRPS